MEVVVGSPMTVNIAPGTEALRAPFANVNSTDDAPTGVFAPITTVTDVVLTTVHDMAAVPLLGVTPTLAVQANPRMKLVPVTVMVLEQYAATGETVSTSTAIAGEYNATDNPASALVLIRKPPVTIARAPPRVSPFRVIVTAAVPVAAPAVERMIEALGAVAAVVEAAANDGTLLAMDMTDPKK